ncbi:hypothetical protein MMC14_003627 [Varicellaria rhodocarpa]|nr:hypothetical protein [Varicellaria rhodocarpa]
MNAPTLDPAIGKNQVGTEVRTEEEGGSKSSSSNDRAIGHGAPEVIGIEGERTVEEIEESKKGWFAYFKTKDFYIVLLLGSPTPEGELCANKDERQILALCITATNTFSSLLVNQGTSIPAFQTWFNYVLLNAIYTSYTIYRYGFKGWGNLILKDGWKCQNLFLFRLKTYILMAQLDIILSFLDVEGNYFTVLAYRYTTILSAQLINFWAIVLVVTISFLFLHVRYHPTQVTGILICVGGMGILLASDHITGANGGNISKGNQLKGDLFALLGATFYGMSNVAEEFLVSKRPLYEVVGQLGFWGMIINGTQAGIFDRSSFRSATWNGDAAGYIVGYTLCLTIFYSLAPIMFRLASAAFFNISLLTGNFWFVTSLFLCPKVSSAVLTDIDMDRGVAIGIKVFDLHIHWMYPLAFVCIIGGLIIYFVGKKVLGEARKPWLGKNQEGGVSGVGTAKRRVERPDAII